MNKIEEVARDLATTIGDNWESPSYFMLEATDTEESCRDFYRELATAAITAMRTPTPQMVNAGTESLHGYGVEYRTVDAYQAMIDAALGEQE